MRLARPVLVRNLPPHPVAFCALGGGLAAMRGTATTHDVGFDELQLGKVSTFLDVVEEDARLATVSHLALVVLAAMTLRSEEMWPTLLLDLFAEQSPSRRMIEAVRRLRRRAKLSPSRRPELMTY